MMHVTRETADPTQLDQSLRGSDETEWTPLDNSGPPPSGPGNATHRAAFGAFVLAAFGLGILPVFLGELNADDTWLLYAAARVLAGETLYVDVVETNPPLIVWLNVLPLLLARAMGISEVLGLRLSVLGLIAGSLLLSNGMLCRVLPDRPASRQFLLVLSLFVLLPLSGYDFGEREHLLLALVLPYLWMASGRARGRPIGVVAPWVVGAMAAVGILLKPYFVPLWIAVEVYVAQIGRDWRAWLRPEAAMVAALGTAYAIAIVAITPEYLALIKWARPVYSDSSLLFPSSLISSPGAMVSMMAWLGFLFVRPRGSLRRCCEVILIANLAFLSAALVQYKGYHYHFYPPFALAVLLLGLLVIESAGARTARFARPDTIRTAVAGMACGGVLLITMAVVTTDLVEETRAWCGGRDKPGKPLLQMVQLAREHANHQSLFTFSANLANSFPLVTYSGAVWASRHPCLWFLPALYAEDSDKDEIVYHPIEAMSDTERSLFESVLDDLLKYRPVLLFVDEANPKWVFHRRRFDYLEYYSQDPRFAAFIKDYEPFARADVFRVYRRKAGTRLAARR